MTLDESHAVVERLPRSGSRLQDPVAVVGISCRLPGHSNSPHELWDLLARGGIASNEPPPNRFNLGAHYDGSGKPRTMRSPGGMFLEDVDPQDIDAAFFGLSRIEAVAMDPQQRQLLEVVYEALESAGITLNALQGQPFGCFVGSYASDYGDMQARDPEDRVPSVTVGIGRAMLSNRISHFLNIKGTSMTIDTACSGSLVSLDVACRYLNTGEINGAIVAGCNLYLSPEHNMDLSAMKGASTLSGKCHTFDAKADGYVKSEGVNTVILKRLDDALRDGDPIRAIVRGSASNSDGWTPGIASPSSEAQASAIRQAYANAGITDFSLTGYLEAHGTGTQAGDPIEVAGIASVFGPTRSAENLLRIGSIKANIGHSEPASGLSGLLKCILSLEKGTIPGNPTFEIPNPQIEFGSNGLWTSKTMTPWPNLPIRRASVNSFGYGGSNCHVILDQPEQRLQRHVSSNASDDVDIFGGDGSTRPHILVFSANDSVSLENNLQRLRKHLINPAVSVELRDLSYTLAERRTHHFYRAYTIIRKATLNHAEVFYGKKKAGSIKVAFVFTGQGAQWPQMGKELIETFAGTKPLLQRLDESLQSLDDPPKWSLLDELVQPRTAEQYRQPQFSQTLVTALQILQIHILSSWNIRPRSVVGHSSGEIAAAYAAGLLTAEDAIKVAYLRGKAALDRKSSGGPVGMLAAGVGGAEALELLKGLEGTVQLACFNSPQSVTLSGSLESLGKVDFALRERGRFSRLLQVDLAYHSTFMNSISEQYENLMLQNVAFSKQHGEKATMFSSVSGERLAAPCDAAYWKSNMSSPVRFEDAMRAMLAAEDAPNFLIEVGPSGALSGPISQIKQSMTDASDVEYCAALRRGASSVDAMYQVAGRLFMAGGEVSMANVNHDPDGAQKPRILIDLPTYSWNHATKYWHENDASKDWRFRKFPHHELLGGKISGTSWRSPSWRKILQVEDSPWLRDHKLGSDIVFPAAGYIAMAMEALHQTNEANKAEAQNSSSAPRQKFRFRNVRFLRAMVLQENEPNKVLLALSPSAGNVMAQWHEFRVSSMHNENWVENCTGLVRLEDELDEVREPHPPAPLQHATPANLWYKAMADAGYTFGTAFQKQTSIESVVGSTTSRSLVDLMEPPSTYVQSRYLMHPVCIDGCFQTAAPSLWAGRRSIVDSVLVPTVIDNMTISALSLQAKMGLSSASRAYIGVGVPEHPTSYKSHITVEDPETGSTLLQLDGLRYSKLDTGEKSQKEHRYTQLIWCPDIEFAKQATIDSMLSDSTLDGEPDSENTFSSLAQAMDLIAHKRPNLRVVEVNLCPSQPDSVWFAVTGREGARAACPDYLYVSAEANDLVEVQGKYDSHHNARFDLLESMKSAEKSLPGDASFDLLILKTMPADRNAQEVVLQMISPLLRPDCFILLLEASITNSLTNGHVLTNGIHQDKDHAAKVAILHQSGLNGPIITLREPIHAEIGIKTASLMLPQFSTPAKEQAPKEVHFMRFSKSKNAAGPLTQFLASRDWSIIVHDAPFDGLETLKDKLLLVADDLNEPLLPNISSNAWAELQNLFGQSNSILWLTVGGHYEVSTPDGAMISGMARTLRAEDPSFRLTTLDLDAKLGEKSWAAVEELLLRLRPESASPECDREFVERSGIVHVSRVTIDEPVNTAERQQDHGAELMEMSLHDSKTCIRLQCERLGTLDSLHYSEVSADELPLEHDHFLEVEIYAAGLNFKDVAVSMGIVPENQHLLGLEGAGVVRRVGPKAHGYRIGDRVMVYKPGTFANRVQVSIDGTHHIPDSMSFEEAATLACVYEVSICGLFDLANLRAGQRVLIHSAAGGVGIAAIQLCQYMGAEIYVTVGTDEKRDYLIKTFNIPSSHIFSSRNTEFAGQIMTLTNGKGLDVILNSLTGAALDESWRCVADCGNMIEIGKKDILDRSSLSMEPFNRNASFRAIDMSHSSVEDSTRGRLLSQLFDLIEKGHVKPITPIKVFPFDNIPAAFRYMRGGSHMGKIVISNGPDAKITVPVRPAQRPFTLWPDVSYLIIGGLRGLCGSLAIYMAQCGARNLVVMSRSGFDDEKSQSVLKNLEVLGCTADLIQGDVIEIEDVRRAFRDARLPIGGVIQGAMVLRDRIFPSLTVEDFHMAVKPKLRGTWNLHNVALECGRDLRFFTMLSSLSGVVGQKSQANYAAANAFLDSFARFRHSHGLTACSVALGVIEDVGYIAERPEIAARLDKEVWAGGINEGQLHKILRMSILQQTASINLESSSQLITGIPVPQSESADLMRDVRFRALCYGDGVGRGMDVTDSNYEIQALFLMIKSKVERSVVLNATIPLVNGQIMKNMGLTEPLEPAKDLSSYGLDSLASMEILNWVRVELRAELTMLDVTNAESLFALCEKIVDKIST